MFPFLCDHLMICDQGNHIPFAFQLWIDMDDVTDFEEQGTLIRFLCIVFIVTLQKIKASILISKNALDYSLSQTLQNTPSIYALLQ